MSTVNRDYPPAPQEEEMKSNRTRLLVIGAAVMIFAAVAALAQGMRGPRHGGFGHLLGFYSDYLDLTSAQQNQVKAIWAKEKPSLQPLMQQMRDFHTQMNQLAESGTFDEAKVRSLATQQSQTMVELAVAHARIKSEMIQVLTTDQKAKLQKLEARRAQRWHKPMGDMAPPEPPSD
jgi:Spy/CpxP family protein refolding chaperone